MDDTTQLLLKAEQVEQKIISNISNLDLQNAYLEIISITKYFVYYDLVTYAKLTWGQRLDNCIGWELYTIFNSPVLTVIFLSDPVAGMASIVANCSWFATFKPNHHLCQNPHPESSDSWIDLD